MGICPWRGNICPCMGDLHMGRGYLPLGGISAPRQGIAPGEKICPLGAYLPLGGNLALGGGICLWGRGITPPSCPHICPPKPLICPMARICPQPHSHLSTGAGGRDLQGHWPHRVRPQLLVNHCYPLRITLESRLTVRFFRILILHSQDSPLDL